MYRYGSLLQMYGSLLQIWVSFAEVTDLYAMVDMGLFCRYGSLLQMYRALFRIYKDVLRTQTFTAKRFGACKFNR